MKTKIFSLFTGFLEMIFPAQSTISDTFESDSDGAATFTSNGQSFTIVGGIVAYSLFSEWDYRKKANDNFFIYSNTATLSIKTADKKKINVLSFWISLPTPGNVTVKGKSDGVGIFNTTFFVNDFTNYPSTNLYVLVDLANFGGINNTDKIIDEVEISAQTDYYLDYFSWRPIPTMTTQEVGKKSLEVHQNLAKEFATIS